MTKEIAAISKELKNVQNCTQIIINSFQKFFFTTFNSLSRNDEFH